MDTYLPDLDEILAIKKETKIPLPDPNYLFKKGANTNTSSQHQLTKYEREFDLYCHWAALPKDLRKPKTTKAFEIRYSLPYGYAIYFRNHEQFQARRLKYFWEWLFDLYPDVVYSIYKRAMKKSSKDAQIFVDIVNKQMEKDRPRMNVAPMVIMGIPQDKIDKLFTPKNYEKVLDATLNANAVNK